MFPLFGIHHSICWNISSIRERASAIGWQPMLKSETSDWDTFNFQVLTCQLSNKLLSTSACFWKQPNFFPVMYVTLSLVMPTFIEVFSSIECVMIQDNILNIVKEALSNSHSVLSKYCGFSDNTTFYLAAVVLDLDSRLNT